MGKEGEYFRDLGEGGRTLTPSVNIGVSSLPDQFVNLQLKKGFTFNIMCIGATGVGKTSLFHTLFRHPLTDEDHPPRSEDVSIISHNFNMREANVNLKVTFIESRGFGDQINKSSSAKNIIEYIETQFETVLEEETKINRNLDTNLDPLVHACLYIISPTGHSLTPLDIVTMKELQSKVNLIPIIGKSDILTSEELKEFKARINVDLRDNGIKIYQFPTDDSTIASKNTDMNNRIPFAVVSSTQEEMINNQLCRVRKYPWGTVVIDDENHCEFSLLRDMLLRHTLLIKF
uniref:Septin-6 (Trinotate prediction) n=1 Tax=Henneguya salminicola TaxID=69463 RepID=A0A6G3MDY6_HENSL